MSRVSLVAVSAAALCCVAMMGCEAKKPSAAGAAKPAASHDHDHDHDHGHDHDHPETLAAGVAELEKALTDVKRHLAADAKEKADDVVHDIGHLVEDLQGLVAKASLPAAAQAAAKKSLDELFECFDTLDTALHAKEGDGEPPAKVHESLAERIAAAVRALKDAAAATVEQPAAKPAEPPASTATPTSAVDETAEIIKEAAKTGKKQ